MGADVQNVEVVALVAVDAVCKMQMDDRDSGNSKLSNDW